MAGSVRWEYQGTASTGEKVSLNLDSIEIVQRSLGMEGHPGYFFTYQIGRDRVNAMTPCNGQFQVADSNGRYGDLMEPQSKATQKMIDRVCGYYRRSYQVFSPPSNVRLEPNGKIICAIRRQTTITTYGTYGEWFYTDACGKLGLIHSSQIR
ncbi:MAG: hypothetical protein B0A82_26580 [Alkalinema sp. CACIAM 70d]|nr:MAG: hypothetical protein B0A82_26580 [Alkalinema sp. CACIAM 70d]